MTTQSQILSRSGPPLLGSEDEIRKALSRQILSEVAHADLVLDREEQARDVRLRLEDAGCRAYVSVAPSVVRVHVSFAPRLTARVARIAAEAGARLELPYGRHDGAPARGHEDPTCLGPGYQMPDGLVGRAEHIGAICKKLGEMGVHLEYEVTAEGRHRLMVGNEGELSLDELSAKDRGTFEQLERFMHLTSRLCALAD